MPRTRTVAPVIHRPPPPDPSLNSSLLFPDDNRGYLIFPHRIWQPGTNQRKNYFESNAFKYIEKHAFAYIVLQVKDFWDDLRSLVAFVDFEDCLDAPYLRIQALISRLSKAHDTLLAYKANIV